MTINYNAPRPIQGPDYLGATTAQGIAANQRYGQKVAKQNANKQGLYGLGSIGIQQYGPALAKALGSSGASSAVPAESMVGGASSGMSLNVPTAGLASAGAPAGAASAGTGAGLGIAGAPTALGATGAGAATAGTVGAAAMTAAEIAAAAEAAGMTSAAYLAAIAL